MKVWHVTNWPDAEVGLVIDTSKWDRSVSWDARWSGFYKNQVNLLLDLQEQPGVCCMRTVQALSKAVSPMMTALENLKEYVFECVRLAEHPHKPSRMRAAFFWPSLADPRASSAKMGLLDRASAVLGVELLDADRAHVADPRHLNCNTAPPRDMETAARSYWSIPAPDAECEILYEGRFRIVSVESAKLQAS